MVFLCHVNYMSIKKLPKNPTLLLMLNIFNYFSPRLAHSSLKNKNKIDVSFKTNKNTTSLTTTTRLSRRDRKTLNDVTEW